MRIRRPSQPSQAQPAHEQYGYIAEEIDSRIRQIVPTTDPEDYDEAIKAVFDKVEGEELTRRIEALGKHIPTEQLLGVMSVRFGDETINDIFRERYEREKRMLALRERVNTTNALELSEVNFGETLGLKLMGKELDILELNLRRIDVDEPVFAVLDNDFRAYDRADPRGKNTAKEKQYYETWRRAALKVPKIPEFAMLRLGTAIDGVMQSYVMLGTPLMFQEAKDFALPQQTESMRLGTVNLNGEELGYQHNVF